MAIHAMNREDQITLAVAQMNMFEREAGGSSCSLPVYQGSLLWVDKGEVCFQHLMLSFLTFK